MKFFCWIVPAIALCSVMSHARATPAAPKSPREFVEEFYRWYVPRAPNDNSIEMALKFKGASFSRELVRRLKEDSAAQASCAELVGLDFDPFLNGQDPAEHYEVGKVRQKVQSYRADIHRLWSGKRIEKPDVSAEFTQYKGHWIFVNFFYPEGGDLLTILRSPRPTCSVPRPNKK